MSANHNRIKVADLEKNQPNKILKTNQNGELEFTDANLQTENYNALDCIAEGKSLDARQGKVLKDLIDNGNVNIATDVETQINTPITEDKKVITRSKLFNWWQWIKSQTQTISGAWNFSNKVTLASGTKDTAPLIIPSGTLTALVQNGAIERDENGNLFHAVSNFYRYKLLDSREYGEFVSTTWKSRGMAMASIYGSKTGSNSGLKTIPLETLGGTEEGQYLFKTFDHYVIRGSNYYPD